MSLLPNPPGPLGRTTLALSVLLVLAVEAVAQGPAPLTPPPAPPGNPPTEAKIRLGQVLFWDEQLSSTRSVACGTCHRPEAGGGDPRSLADPASVHPGADGMYGSADDVRGSLGVPRSDEDGVYLDSGSFRIREQVTSRRAPSAIDAGYAPELFWDGRAGGILVDPITGEVVLPSGAALESQALAPILSTVEMAHAGRAWSDVVERLGTASPLALAGAIPPPLANFVGGRGYPELFAEAFGSPEITPTRIAMAIASHERTLFSDRTPFDLELAGGGALTPLQRQGRQVFNDNGCNLCHVPPVLSDQRFHYIGVRPVGEDLGRFAVSGNPIDRGAQKTPSLRNASWRAPYMHDGRFATLAEVVDFYDRGGDFAAPNKSPLIVPLGLSEIEKAALVAFLGEALADPRVGSASGPFARPQLFSESERRVAVDPEGGVAGSGGLAPGVVAVEPPLAGNPSFTLGVDRALGGALATLVVDLEDPGPGPVVPSSAALARASLELSGAGALQGFGSVALVLPASGDLVGAELFGRWYVEDPDAPDGLAISPLFRFRIFPAAVPLFYDDLESGGLGSWSAVSP